MSLTAEQISQTKKEFQHNVELLHLTIDEMAMDLKTTPEVIKRTLALTSQSIEDPWILKNYIEKKAKSKEIVLVPFSVLHQDYHTLWFLNSEKIDQQRIG